MSCDVLKPDTSVKHELKDLPREVNKLQGAEQTAKGREDYTICTASRRRRLCSTLARSDAEHGDESAHEDAKVVRRDGGEEGSAQNGVCQAKGCVSGHEIPYRSDFNTLWPNPSRSIFLFGPLAHSFSCPYSRDASKAGPLTDAEDDDEDDEGVHHGDDGGGDGGDHGLEGLDAAEEADDAEGPHELDEPVGDGGHRVGGEGSADDDDVEPVPAVQHEAAEPVAEEVEKKLDGESEGEEHVDARVRLPEVRQGAVLVDEKREKLGV